MTDNAKLLTEIPFDLPGKIYRSPMPFGPYDRMSQVWQLYQEKDVNQVVILVEQQEYLVHARRDLPKFYRSEGMDVIHFPIPDFQVPADKDVLATAIEDVLDRAQGDGNIAVHCLAGIGRTGIFLACTAKRQLNLDGQQAIGRIRQYMPSALENEEQEQFVVEF